MRSMIHGIVATAVSTCALSTAAQATILPPFLDHAHVAASDYPADGVIFFVGGQIDLSGLVVTIDGAPAEFERVDGFERRRIGEVPETSATTYYDRVAIRISPTPPAGAEVVLSGTACEDPEACSVDMQFTTTAARADGDPLTPPEDVRVLVLEHAPTDDGLIWCGGLTYDLGQITVDVAPTETQPGERIYVRFGETLLEASPDEMPTTFYISDKDGESVTAPCYTVGRIDAAGRTAEVEMCAVCRHTEWGELGSFEFDAVAELADCTPSQAPCEEGPAFERDPVDGVCYATEGGCDPDDVNHPCNEGPVNCGDGFELDPRGNCVPATGCDPQNVDCAPSNGGENDGCNASGRDTRGSWLWAILVLAGLRRRVR